ncbi:MAG: phosphatase PAP2 family protein [Bacillota bacterium]|nr:phosphatase PAP2 family protein [Bacillota bacterium]
MEELKKAFISDWRNIIKRGAFGLLVPLVSGLYPILNRYNPDAKVLITVIDNLIPFNKYFIIFYVTWYEYVAFFIIYLCIFDKEDYWKVLISVILGMSTAYVIFYFFPTTVPRPTLSGDDIFTGLVRAIYSHDLPFNCFPSIHVINTLLVQFYITRNKDASKILKIICNIIGILIIISTMFIKQHVFLDAVSAAVIAYIIYYLVNYILHDKGLINKLF